MAEFLETQVKFVIKPDLDVNTYEMTVVWDGKKVMMSTGSKDNHGINLPPWYLKKIAQTMETLAILWEEKKA